jgi:hypothetical protein
VAERKGRSEEALRELAAAALPGLIRRGLVTPAP